ncbi:hypothetical protein ACF06Q_08170 [Streptomyces leeuwenhoekii]|uniref:hypothetical protein n=1 Tax=Streptomyces leeuwenhoekii TaxID=1437453 RepID=UPI0036F6171E
MPAPSQATLYRLVTALAMPGELPTGPVRQVPASADGRAFTPTMALGPLRASGLPIRFASRRSGGGTVRQAIAVLIHVVSAPRTS